ncbi:MAG: hypothetical protein QM708_11345 [Propioniciclava sp.]|uniref:phenylacetate--CoA ligase family protein n=1 Tax=Propioniciclava sp. TaxID=2038686 RepID=UPI0039E3BFAD
MPSLAELAFVAKSRTIKHRSGDYLRELLAHERLTPAEVLTLQRERAASIARFAAEQSPYYTRLLKDAGVDLDRIEEPAEWARIPITDRASLREHESEVLSAEATPRNAVVGLTGGSTGEPLRIRRDARVPLLALAWRMYRWWGIEPWDNLARIGRWGFGRLDSVKSTLSWWPSSQVYLDAKYFDPASMADFHRRLLRTRPALLEGYVGAMVAFADFLDEHDLRVPSLRAIATTAAPLTESVRQRLESVYGVPVYDEYRGSEVNWMAGECREQNGLHIFADARMLEIVDENGQPVPAGTLGDIVITDLANRVFPIIRYRLGDRGILREGPCPCGIGLPVMEPVQGRTTDLIRLPGGGGSNHGIMGMFGNYPRAVRMFQVRQARDYSIEVLVVRGDEENAEENIERVIEGFRRQLRDLVPVTIRYVDSLESPGGKLKYLVSEVDA